MQEGIEWLLSAFSAAGLLRSGERLGRDSSGDTGQG
jgi:hypothetical protein